MGWKIVEPAVKVFLGDADTEYEDVEVYESWDVYYKREGDILEQYRPPRDDHP